MLSLATLLLCLKHRTWPRRRSGGKGRNAGSGHWAGTWNRRLNLRQELLQHGLGLFNRGCSGQPEFRDQPVLEGSRGTFHPSFGLGRQGEYDLDTQFCHRPRPNWVGVPVDPDPGVCLKTAWRSV